MTRIRNREATDLDGCVQALTAVYQGGSYPTNWPADPARWLSPPDTIRAWVAETAATGEKAASEQPPIAGHVLLTQPPARPPDENPATGNAAEIGRLFVVPATRRQGIAAALLGETMRWARANDRDLVLYVTDHLQAARALYQRLGFRLAATTRADWTTPDGQPVTLLRYAWSS